MDVSDAKRLKVLVSCLRFFGPVFAREATIWKIGFHSEGAIVGFRMHFCKFTKFRIAGDLETVSRSRASLQCIRETVARLPASQMLEFSAIQNTDVYVA